MDDILLDSERDARLQELAELRDRGDRPLTETEANELETLIGEMGQAMVERDLAAAARYRNISVEVARKHIVTQAVEAEHFWSELSADPERMATEIKAAQAQRQARPG